MSFAQETENAQSPAVAFRAAARRRPWAPSLDAFALDRIQSAFGAGIRFMVSPKERLGVRVDVGFAAGKPEFYLNFAEAF